GGDERCVIGQLTQPDDDHTPADAGIVQARLKVAAPADLFAERSESAEDSKDGEIGDHVGGDLPTGRPSATARTPVHEARAPRDAVSRTVNGERNGQRP